ncbi:hypothetical protein N311_00031, partial [Apaloderma vittatum]
GSLGVDVETAVEVTLTDTSVTLIPTTAYGPLVSTTSLVGALLIGRSSTGKQGVVVLPGVIDADFTGQIQIMAYALQPPVTIQKGSKIAQIVALEAKHLYQPHPKNFIENRGDAGFGSTGYDVFLTLDLNQRPQQCLVLQKGNSQVQVRTLFDTGADVTIVN